MVDLQVSLDMAASSLEEIADLILDNMINCGSLSTDKKDQVKKNRIGKEKISFQPFFLGKGSHAEKAPAPVRGFEKAAWL